MKYRLGGHGFFDAGRAGWAALFLSAALPLAACTTASIDEVAPSAPAVSTASGATVPQPTPRPEEPAASEQALAPVEEDRAAAEPPTRPRNTGQYPNLNITPGTAAEQITPEEKTEMLGELRAKQAAVAAEAAEARPADQVEALREIGARHGEEALKAIEAQSQ